MQMSDRKCMPRLDRPDPFPCEVDFDFRYNFGPSKPFSTIPLKQNCYRRAGKAGQVDRTVSTAELRLIEGMECSVNVISDTLGSAFPEVTLPSFQI
jgi:hypothetical protein